MLTELTQLEVKSDSDILRLHQLSIQVAGWAGLSVAEQICFAVNVSNNSFNLTHEGDLVIFSIGEKKTGHSYLRAEMRDKLYTIEKELPSGINTNSLPVFHENTVIAKNEWERYRDMQQFTFALSHDLKNSLTKLKLALSLVEEEEIPSPIDNYIQIMHRSADRLESMMLSLNKIIQLGDGSPDVVRSLSPELIFNDVQEEFAEIISNQHTVIHTDFSKVAELNYIEVYLKSILSNLLSNAIKYAAADRPLQITVTASGQQDAVVFTFTDNGQGIDLSLYSNQLFQPFTRFSSKNEGSGVGLYIIKNMVERNGGSITVESRPGEGTTFRVVLQQYPLPS